MNRVLVFHTAFPGDIVLTLPLLQRLRTAFPPARISMVTIPLASDLLRNHPAVDERIVYDKKGAQRGIAAALRLARDLRRSAFDVALIPHRSLRSALICRLAGIPRRIGFSTSAGRLLLTDEVHDDRRAHEIVRNLSLLNPLNIAAPGVGLPEVFPGEAEREAVEGFLAARPFLDRRRLIAVAPGSVWNTKRWPAAGFAGLLRLLIGQNLSPVLVGGKGDRDLCREIAGSVDGARVADASGEFSLLGSAELLRRCRVCVSNDSAPMHLAVAVHTPVIAIFGPTVPEFGFGPAGENDGVVQISGLSCRPCSIHGGAQCPIGTFDCMLRITPEQVFDAVVQRIS